MINNETLSKLADMLNKNNIVWGIGGSYLLHIYGLYDSPNDLDIWIQPKDMGTVKKIFNNFEKIKSDIQLPEEYHLKINFFDIEVDFVSCFIITPNQNKFNYNISPETVYDKFLINNVQIFCTTLEDWYLIYKILKRENKASIIEKVFTEKKIPLSEKMMHANLSRIDNNIQRRVRKDANKLIEDATQYSLTDYINYKNKEKNNGSNDSAAEDSIK
ncbi:MAG: hypothetical protein IJB74_05845 [Clostridia bacterium]|nr:hypothetical protein [Clostridia bacterium]